MAMAVRMQLRHTVPGFMRMTLVMRVCVLVFERNVRVFMKMALREMQPETNAHQRPGGRQFQREGFVQQRNRDNRAEERREGEIRSRARRP